MPKIDYDQLFHNPKLEEQKQKRKEIYQDIRTEISCCCSWSRYEEINSLLDELEELDK